MTKVNMFNVYLADLFYDQNAKYHCVPLNIGYIGNALKVTFGEALNVELFKYPDDLLAALKKNKPDVLGLSNYVWNQYLSLKFASFAKKISNDIFIIMGGPNIRGDAGGLKDFLDINKDIDCYVPYVGEFPVIELIRGILKTGCGTKVQSVYEAVNNIAGAYLNVPAYKYQPINPSIWKDVFTFGSPYLNGLLDKFLTDVKLHPLFESNRGCPYRCTYCAFGVADYKKVYLNDLDVVLKELEYVGEHCLGQNHWYIADANFGIFDRDIIIANALKETKNKYSYPLAIDGTTGKGKSHANVIKIVKILKNMIRPNIAVQSFDRQVLDNIHRNNIDDSIIKELVSIYEDSGVETSTDIILGLSGETYQSHISTLKKAIELNLNFSVATLAMLPDTAMDTAEERKKYGFDTKFRFRADSYGMYNNEFVFDLEEVVCGTNTLSFEEFLDLRSIHLLIYMLWSAKIGRMLLTFGQTFNKVDPVDVIRHIQLKPVTPILSQILKELCYEMKGQFFESKEALIKHYSNKEMTNTILKNGETKLFWKHFANILANKAHVITLIDEIVEVLSSYKDANLTALSVLRKISVDRLFIDFMNATSLDKQEEYKIDHENYSLLLKKGIIPNKVIYIGGKMIVKYTYDKKQYLYYHDVMKRFNHNKNPNEAFNAALNLDLGEHILYDITE